VHLFLLLVTSLGNAGPYTAASDAVGPAFLRCGGASPRATARSMKAHVAHRRIKIERVYRPLYLCTAAVVPGALQVFVVLLSP
jgi:hypothetical protein